jgi:hypothetical protein
MHLHKHMPILSNMSHSFNLTGRISAGYICCLTDHFGYVLCFSGALGADYRNGPWRILFSTISCKGNCTALQSKQYHINNPSQSIALKKGMSTWYQIGNDQDTISFDLKPSDAINIAFRCKVCICFLYFSFAVPAGNICVDHSYCWYWRCSLYIFVLVTI